MSKPNRNTQRNGNAQSSNGARSQGTPRNAMITRSGKTLCTDYKSNPIEWYNHNEALMKDAGRLSFNNPLGAKFTVLNGYTGMTNSNEIHNHVPGIMVLNYIYGPGLAASAADAVNIAAKDIYSWVRHANSGSANYDAPDLMMYLLAFDAAVVEYSRGRRLLRTLMFASARNRYLGKYLVEAQGFKYEDIITHIADLRSYLNTVALKLTALNAPKAMPLFERHSWLTSGLWADSDDIGKAQLYLFNPDGYYTYNEAVTPGRLDWNSHGFSAGTETFANFQTIMELILNNLLSSEDIGIMSGDILKAYGSDNCYKIAGVGDDDVIEPIYDETVLSQIQNLTCYTYTGVGQIAADACHITQTDDGLIMWNPKLWQHTASVTSAKEAVKGVCLNKLITSPKVDPTPEEVTEMTRLTNFVKPMSGANDLMWWEFVTCGTEFVRSVMVYRIASGTTASMQGATYAPIQSNFSSVPTGASLMTSLVSSFDWHPEYLNVITSGAGDITGMYRWFELQNYTVLDPQTAEKLHDMATLSLFGCPNKFSSSAK